MRVRSPLPFQGESNAPTHPLTSFASTAQIEEMDGYMTSSESDRNVTKVVWDESGVSVVAPPPAVVVTSSLSKKDPSFGMGGGFVLTTFTEADKVVYESDAGQGGRLARWAVLIDWLKGNPKLGSQIKVREGEQPPSWSFHVW